MVGRETFQRKGACRSDITLLETLHMNSLHFPVLPNWRVMTLIVPVV